MTEQERTDLDETRRLATIARVGLAAGRPLSLDLVGTLVHAIHFHAEYVNRGWAEELGKQLLQGNQKVGHHLDTLIQVITRDLAA